jgi:two-component system nitrogen regulation sensor histidine kinase NtrY
VTVLPAVCVFIFALLFFNIGIENLFKTPIKNVIDNAEQVASIYVDDMAFNMKRFVNGIKEPIKECINGVSIDAIGMSKILEDETSTLKVDAMVFQVIDRNNISIIARNPFSLSLQFEELPRDITCLDVDEVISWESGDSILSMAVISSDLGIYLMASITVDKIIMDHKRNIKTAIMEYANLSTQRSGLKFSFMTLFSAITAFLFLTSIFIGILFANWILKPINKLIIATKNVTSGNYDTPIKNWNFKNEWDVLIVTFNDMMSKLKQQKQQLIISNKQNAWRDIARKIAHEIKNPLTPIQLSAERLKSKFRDEISTNPAVFDTYIDTIIRQVNCIGNLVNEFSNFARMPAPNIRKVDIVKLLKEAVLIQVNANSNVKFHQNYAVDEYFCDIDSAQINQVLMNLLQNAVNSLAESMVSRSKRVVGNVLVTFNVIDEEMYITVEDDGPGFSEIAVEKALDPYYTTRENGTGLGLAIVHKIVTEHFGKIMLEKSTVLCGAKVSVAVPSIYRVNKE